MLAKSLSRLSTGSKIINPADDAAGLAVASRLDAQIRRLDATEYARYGILVQSGTAMLAQANQLPQSVLRLLN